MKSLDLMKIRGGLIGTCILVVVATPAAATQDGAEPTPRASEVAARFGLEPVASLPSAPVLEDYLGYALQHSDDLAAAAAEQQAARSRGQSVGALPNPRFTWSEAIEPVETRVGPQERIFALTQQFPWFGTLGLQEDVADDRAAAAAARVDAVALRVLRDVRVDYNELVYLEQATETTSGHLVLLVQYEAVARARYETGRGTYADVVKAQVEMAMLEDRLAGLRDRRRPLVARFNAALGRSAGGAVQVTAIEPVAVSYDTEDLRARVLQANPELILLSHDAASQLKAGQLAGKQRYPGLSLGVSYIQVGNARNPGVVDSGKDAFFATLGLTVPLWRGSYGAAEQEAEGHFRAVEHQRSDVARRLTAQLEQAVFDQRDAQRRHALYGLTLLPKARQSLAAARSTYEAGDASFLALVDAERVLLEFELAGVRAASDLLISLAEIERLIAGPVRRNTGQKEE